MMMVIPLLLELQPAMAFPVLLVTRQRGGLAPQREEMGRHPAGGGAKGRRRHGRRGEGWRGWRPQEVGGGGRCEGARVCPPPLCWPATRWALGPTAAPHLGSKAAPLGPQGLLSGPVGQKPRPNTWRTDKTPNFLYLNSNSTRNLSKRKRGITFYPP